MSHSGKAWEEGRLRTLSRDNYQCQDCGRRTEIHVHHIQRPEEFDSYDDGHHPSNLVSLCKWCHPKWEGKNVRPILLNGGGAKLHRVVESLTRETIENLTFRFAGEEMHDHLILKNHRTCDKCSGADGTHSTTGIEHLSKTVDAFVRAALRDEPFEYRSRTGPNGERIQSRFIANWICDGCRDAYSDIWDPISLHHMLDGGWWASVALERQGVPHNPRRIYETIKDLKSREEYAGKDKHIMSTAIARAVQSGESDEEWPRWFCDVVKMEPDDRPPSITCHPGSRP